MGGGKYIMTLHGLPYVEEKTSRVRATRSWNVRGLNKLDHQQAAVDLICEFNIQTGPGNRIWVGWNASQLALTVTSYTDQKKNGYANGKQRIHTRTSMAHRDDVIRRSGGQCMFLCLSDQNNLKPKEE